MNENLFVGGGQGEEHSLVTKETVKKGKGGCNEKYGGKGKETYRLGPPWGGKQILAKRGKRTKEGTLGKGGFAGDKKVSQKPRGRKWDLAT